MKFHYPQKKFSIQRSDEGVTLVSEMSTLELDRVPAEVWVESDKTGVEIKFDYVSTFREMGETIFHAFEAPAVDNLSITLFND
jgi:hypothetical protein